MHYSQILKISQKWVEYTDAVILKNENTKVY